MEHGPTDPDYTDPVARRPVRRRSTVRDDAIEIGLGEWTGPDY